MSETIELVIPRPVEIRLHDDTDGGSSVRSADGLPVGHGLTEERAREVRACLNLAPRAIELLHWAQGVIWGYGEPQDPEKIAEMAALLAEWEAR